MPELKWAIVCREMPKDLADDFGGEGIVYLRLPLSLSIGNVGNAL
jgi:hypothetical protein